MRIIQYGFVISLILTAVAFGQESVPNFSIGARNMSLADANIAESQDISVMYENPAALAYLENGSVLLNHSQGNGGEGMQENVAFPILLQSPIDITVGLDLYHMGFLNASVPSAQRLLEYGYDVAFAGNITPTLSLGGSAAFRHGATGGGSQAWGAYFGVGADYAPTPDITYSLVYGSIGRDISFAQGDTMLAASSNMLPKTLEVGATMRYPLSASLRPPVLIVSFANEKRFGTTGLFYRGGIEIRPATFLEMRFGYMAGPGISSARYGLGFLGYDFSIQYAIYPLHGTHILLQEFSVATEF